GFIPSYMVYFSRSMSSIFFRRGPLESIHKLLSEGYYFDRIYYAIFLDGFPRLCSCIYNQIENRIIDRINYAVAGAAQFLSQSFRPTHTGNLNYNMSAVLIGLAGIFILIIIIVGW
ncbi:MAG: hypothetical protein QXK72_05505, partial [Candidatus Bathyarchaeia archaeon]